MVALYKGEDQRTDPNSYRLLSMMSVVSKVFEKVLDNRIRVWGERTGVLSDLQGGFRTNRGTVDQLFILNEIVAHRRENGESTFLTFIDVSARRTTGCGAPAYGSSWARSASATWAS